ncbi:MAG TPA: hypothetical protein VMS65_17640 [Polyangiaceae bacterium]|nr:hypothetical protein [Polyangiaceae bacterium]
MLFVIKRPLQEQRSAIVAEFTRAYLERLLEVTGGSQSRAGRIAGVERSYLRRLLSQHGLLPSDRSTDLEAVPSPERADQAGG